MDLIIKSITYALTHQQEFTHAIYIHLLLSFISLGIGAIICIPLSVICLKSEKLVSVVSNIINSLRVVPSLAIITLVMPFLGTGFTPAIIALVVLSGPAIFINSVTGFKEIPSSVIEVADGLGMNSRELFLRVKLPLAMSLILTGIRTASVSVVSGAIIAAFIGGGGLGEFIIIGLSMYDFAILLVGASAIALIAIVMDGFFALVQKMYTRYEWI